MTVRDLILKMRGEEKVVIYHPGGDPDVTGHVDEIINEREYLLDKTVSMIWVSYQFNKAIMIELE